MPSVEKRKTKRGVVFRGIASHEGKRLNAGTHRTKGAALAAAAEVERLAKIGNIAGATNKILRDVFDKYIEEVSPRKRGERWERIRLTFYSRDPIALKPLAKLTRADFDDLCDRRLKEVKPSTLERDLVLLGHALKVAREDWRWLDHSPMHRMRRPTSADMPPRERRLQEGELEALRIASGYRPDEPSETATARVIAAFEFAIETAMRGGEIVALLAADCHKSHVHVRQSKTGERRDVPLSPRARQILDQILAMKLTPVFGIDNRQRDALFRKLRRKAGIEGLNFHDSRREATSRLAKKFDLLELSRITGHRDLELLRNVYYRPSIEDLAAKLR